MPIKRQVLRSLLFAFSIMLLLISGLSSTYAQSISLSSAQGPPGSGVTIFFSGGFAGFDVECFVNGGSIGAYPYDTPISFTIPGDAAQGTVYFIECRQPGVPDGFTASASFTVIASDSDGDGLPDNADACPGVFAQTQNGCPPDSDGDGLPDNADACPAVFAQTQNGCPPDSDGDGVPDNADACPAVFAQTQNGCPPDSDGDGVPDNADACPSVFAQTQNGCPPDSDGDGVLDNADACPAVFAQTQNGCPPATATTEPSATPAPQPTQQPTTAPPSNAWVIPAEIDWSSLQDCADLIAPSQQVPLTEVIRIVASDDPCGNLREALRRQRFGSPNLPSPLSQPRSAELRCSTDPRSVPSTDYMWLDTNYSRFGSTIRLSWAGVTDAELCAAQAGDPFRLVLTRNIIPPLDRAEYYTGVCYGILTGVQMREAMTRLRAGADREVATLLISSLSTSSRLTGQQVWCHYLQRRILNISQEDIDQQNALLNRLVECRIIQNAEVDIWRARISEGQAGFTWNDLAAYIGHLGRRCLSNQDFLLFIANNGIFLNAVTSISLPVATAAPVTQLFELGSAPDLVTLLGPLETTSQSIEIARCPTDSRPLPTPEMQALIDRLNRLTNGAFDPNQGTGLSNGAVVLGLLMSQLSESGVCAIMRGDPFGTISGISGVVVEERNYVFWTSTCLGGPYPDSAYLGVPMMRRVMGDRRTAAAITSVNAATSAAEKTRLWCSHVNTIIGERPPLPITPAQQATLDYFADCIGASSEDMALLYAVLTSEGGIAQGLPYRVPITFEEFISIIDNWRAANPTRCPRLEDIIAIVEQLTNSRVITELSASVELAETRVVFGIVYDVNCNTQNLNFAVSGRVPPGCVARNGGSFIEANTTRDSFEIGIAGVEVSIYRGTCNEPGGGRLVGTATTNADGYFELGNLQDEPHCLAISRAAGGNASVLGEGQWWTFAGVGGTTLYFNVMPNPTTVGTISSVPNFGWWRTSESGVTTRMGSGGEMLYSAADTVSVTYDPGLWSAETSSGELTTPSPNIPFIVNVYRAYCEPSGWDGTLANVPPGCMIREDGRLIPDHNQQTLLAAPPNNYTEPGVANVTIAVFENGDCERATPDYVFVTGADGLARGSLPASAEGTAYCVVVDAMLPSNADALGVGRWVHTPVPQSVSRIILTDSYRLGLSFNLLWWLTGTGVPRDDDPIPVPPAGASGGADPGRAGGAGFTPIIPLRDAAVCAAGDACVPTVTLGRPAAPNAVVALPLPSNQPRTIVAPASEPVDAEAEAAFDAALGSGWRSAVIDTSERGVFIGVGADGSAPNLFLLEGGGIFDIGQGATISEHGAALSPGGDMLGYIGRDASDSGTLYLFDVNTGAYRALFSDSRGAALTDDAVAWDGDGRTLYFTAARADGGMDIYSLPVDEPGAIPALFLADARQPALTPDGLLLAFVRDGAIVVRFLDTGDEYIISESAADVTCEQPFFDANGIDLYFICRQGETTRLYQQGASGLVEIVTGADNLRYVGPGPVSGTLIWDDGATVILAANDGSNAAPFIQLPDLRVMDLRWGG